MYFTQRINENLQRLQQLERIAQWIATNGSADDAMQVGQAAAEWAWYNITGAWHSPALEQVAADLGQSLPVFPTKQRPSDATQVKRVLHVLSEAHHSAGGHVRMAWRWINQDNSREHSVVVINQPAHEGPSPTLYKAVDGRIEVLNAASHSQMSRAGRLRQIATEFDMVVLHIHPYDMVASAALSSLPSVPIVLFNHADHVFWTGIGATDTIACFRGVGGTISIEQRGITPDRVLNLPLIVDDINKQLSRADARSALGITDSQRVLLTAASAYKMIDANDLAFMDLIMPVIERDANTLLFVAGGGDHSSWGDIEARTGGRVRILGSVDNLQPYFASADIYLDPYPVCSGTSLLEAAAYGLPAVGYCRDPQMAEALHDANFEADNIIRVAKTVSAYRADVELLLNDPTERSRRGAAAREGVEASYLGDNWQRQLETVYQETCAWKGSREATNRDRVEATELDIAVMRLHEAGGMIRPFEQVMASNALSAEALDSLNAALVSATVK